MALEKAWAFSKINKIYIPNALSKALVLFFFLKMILDASKFKYDIIKILYIYVHKFYAVRNNFPCILAEFKTVNFWTEI